jgi:hypothetical protein
MLFIQNLYAESVSDIFLKKLQAQKVSPPVSNTPVTPPLQVPILVPTPVKNYKLKLQSQIEYFTIESTDNNSGSKSEIISNLSYRHIIEVEKIISQISFGIWGEIHSYDLLNSPKNSTLSINNLSNQNFNYGFKIKYFFSNQNLEFNAGMEKIVFIKAINANTLTVNEGDSPFVQLKYQYSFQLDPTVFLSPSISYKHQFPNESNTIKTKIGKNYGGGLELKKDLKKLELFFNSHFYKRLQSNNISKEKENNLQIGVGINIAF